MAASAPPADSARDRARRRLFGDAWALIASTVSNAAAGIVTYVLSARLFPDAVVGTAAGMTSAMLLLAGMSQLDLTNVLHRFLPTAGPASTRLVVRSCATSALVGVVLAAAFVVLFGEGVFGRDRGSAVVWFPCAVVLWNLFTLQDQVLVGLGAARLVPLENTAHGLLRIGLLVAVAVAGGGAVAVFSTWLLPAVLLLVVVGSVIALRLLPAHQARAPVGDDPLDLRRVVRFAAGGYAGNLSSLVLTSLLPILVIAQLGRSTNAHFYMAWTVASTVDLVIANFGASLVVQGALHRDHVPYLLRSALRRQVLLVVPGLLVLAVAAHPLLRLAFGPAYADESSTMLTLLSLGLVPRIVWGVYLPAVRLAGDARAIAVSQVLTNAAVLAATIAGLVTGGLVGIGVGYLVAQVGIAAVTGPKLLRALRGGGRGGLGSSSRVVRAEGAS